MLVKPVEHTGHEMDHSVEEIRAAAIDIIAELPFIRFADIGRVIA